MRIEDIGAVIARELKIKPKQAEATMELLDGGNTVPFISRYRKEATGELDEEQVRTVEERMTYLRNLVKRQEEIVAKIEEQGKMTDELRDAIEKAQKLQELEDLYLPYKQKKRTRAQIARERGLAPRLEARQARLHALRRQAAVNGHDEIPPCQSFSAYSIAYRPRADNRKVLRKWHFLHARRPFLADKSPGARPGRGFAGAACQTVPLL